VKRSWRGLIGLTVLIGLGWLQGCATAQNPDPFETVNRRVFDFNDRVDEVVLVPVAQSYRDWVPQPVRTGIRNVASNATDGWSAINLFLQGRGGDGLSELTRFLTNSTFGLLGVLDIATELGLERYNEDFGQTLGKWGVGPGAYIVWPFLGPSSVRDSIGTGADQWGSLESRITPLTDRYAFTATRLLDTRARLLGATGMLDSIALDKYSFVRNGYLQRRRSLVYDGNPPEEEPPPEDRYDPAADK